SASAPLEQWPGQRKAQSFRAPWGSVPWDVTVTAMVHLMGMEPRRFDASYRETLELRDGSTVELRPIRPEDKPIFLDGFARLTPESRYLRFFTGKDHLTDAELAYLTEVDGERHFALGAIAPDGRGAGVARFVRLEDEPDVAELAVTVV